MGNRTQHFLIKVYRYPILHEREVDIYERIRAQKGILKLEQFGDIKYRYNGLRMRKGIKLVGLKAPVFTLKDELRADEYLSPATAYSYALKMIELVHMLHSDEIIIRILKPESFLIDTDGNWYIVGESVNKKKTNFIKSKADFNIIFVFRTRFSVCQASRTLR